MDSSAVPGFIPSLKEPRGLSPRIQWLRDYYFQGTRRTWNNEFTAWTTGTPWDVQFNELTFYIVPETYPFLQTFRASFRQAARPVNLDPDFWTWSLPERRAWFVREVMVNYLPQEILPGDLIAGGRFNLQTSLCLTKRSKRNSTGWCWAGTGPGRHVKWFHDHGYGKRGRHQRPPDPRLRAAAPRRAGRGSTRTCNPAWVRWLAEERRSPRASSCGP